MQRLGGVFGKKSLPSLELHWLMMADIHHSEAGWMWEISVQNCIFQLVSSRVQNRNISDPPSFHSPILLSLWKDKLGWLWNPPCSTSGCITTRGGCCNGTVIPTKPKNLHELVTRVVKTPGSCEFGHEVQATICNLIQFYLIWQNSAVEINIMKSSSHKKHSVNLFEAVQVCKSPSLNNLNNYQNITVKILPWIFIRNIL